MLCLRLHDTSHKQILGAFLEQFSRSTLAFPYISHYITGCALPFLACHPTSPALRHMSWFLFVSPCISHYIIVALWNIISNKFHGFSLSLVACHNTSSGCDNVEQFLYQLLWLPCASYVTSYGSNECFLKNFPGSSFSFEEGL